MATISADNIASVSLKDADRDPEGFAQKLGRSFEEYGFAIIADHGILDDLIHRAEDKAKDSRLAFLWMQRALLEEHTGHVTRILARVPVPEHGASTSTRSTRRCSPSMRSVTSRMPRSGRPSMSRLPRISGSTK